MDKETKKLVEELKGDIELIKFSIPTISGIKISLDDLERGRYGEGDKR